MGIITAVPNRILVTGGAGFIGSHTVRALVDSGERVRVLDSLRPPVHPPGRRPDLPDEVEFIEGSVDDRAALRAALADIDVVYHLAAYQDYLTDFSTFYAINTVSTALIYELALAEKLPLRRVILAATQAEYGEGPYRCPTDGTVYPAPRADAQLAEHRWEPACPRCGGTISPIPAREDVVHPHSPYAMSKRAAEECALTLGDRYGIPTAALRYSIVQGPGQSFRNAYSGALRAFTVQALHGRRPLVYEDGQQIRDFVWIGDVVAANLLMLHHPAVPTGSFNVGGDREVRVLDVARMVSAAIGTDLEPDVPGIYRVGDTRHIRSDVTRLRELGWRPTATQEDMVAAYVGWARAQPDMADTSIVAVRRMRELGVLRQAATR